MHTRVKTMIGSVAALATVSSVALAQTDFFRDVPTNHWAYPFIRWAFDNHLMTGPGGQERVFQPSSPVTRAELAQSLKLLYDKIRAETEVSDERAFDLERELPEVSEDAEDRVERLLRQQQEEERRAAAAARAASARYGSSRSFSSPMSLPPPARVTVFASLSGSQEVPRVVTSGRGSANFRWTSGGLYYDITINGLTGPVTAAHFHRGMRGEDGPVVDPVVFDGNRAAGVWMNISAEEWRDIVDGRMYINVHTSRYPDGEIRGQLQVNR